MKKYHVFTLIYIYSCLRHPKTFWNCVSFDPVVLRPRNSCFVVHFLPEPPYAFWCGFIQIFVMKPEKSSSFINIFLFLPCCAHLETASAWLVLSLRSDVNRKNLASIVVRDTTLAGPESTLQQNNSTI